VLLCQFVDSKCTMVYHVCCLLQITKIMNKKKCAVYSFRQSFPLCGMTVYLFDTPRKYCLCRRPRVYLVLLLRTCVAGQIFTWVLCQE